MVFDISQSPKEADELATRFKKNKTESPTTRASWHVGR